MLFIKTDVGKLFEHKKRIFYVDGSIKEEITPFLCIEVYDAFCASFFNLRTNKEEYWIPAREKMGGESLTRVT